jgi:DNA replication protein DnaC
MIEGTVVLNALEKGAKFRYQATLEELNYNPERKLDKGLVTILATCEYLSKGESIVISGATGCGKSFLASALGHHACSHGYSVAYFNTQKLLMRIKMSRLDGTIMKIF